MATRQEFLSQLQEQLGSWSQWVRELEAKAEASAGKLSEDARAVYERRAAHVKELIGQGKGQIERLAAASDDAWEGMSAGAEQAWSSLRDVAASLASQPEPAVRKARARVKVVKKKAAIRKKAAGAKKKVAATKRKVRVKAKVKPAARKAKRKLASKARSPARKKAARKK